MRSVTSREPAQASPTSSPRTPRAASASSRTMRCVMLGAASAAQAERGLFAQLRDACEDDLRAFSELSDYVDVRILLARRRFVRSQRRHRLCSTGFHALDAHL